MNQAARRVIVRSIFQLEVDRLATLVRREALEQDLRNHDREVELMVEERTALMEALGALTPEERALLASARDVPPPAAPGRVSPLRRPRARTAASRKPAGQVAGPMVLNTDDSAFAV